MRKIWIPILNTQGVSSINRDDTRYHDDLIKWKHFRRYWPFVHKVQWHGALMFSLICAWTNSWANNGDAGDLRRYRGHYDVVIMILEFRAWPVIPAPYKYPSLSTIKCLYLARPSLKLKHGFSITTREIVQCYYLSMIQYVRKNKKGLHITWFSIHVSSAHACPWGRLAYTTMTDTFKLPRWTDCIWQVQSYSWLGAGEGKPGVVM